MASELRPGHDLDNLLQRADAARHGDKGTRSVEHRMFAGMHVFGDDQLVEIKLVAVGSLDVE